MNIDFFQPVDAKADESTYKVLPRSVQMHLMKKDGDEFWPRLLADKAKEKNQVTIDWDRWVDEDDEGDGGGFDTSGMDRMNGAGGGFGGMPGMGGMGGMGGMPGMGGMGGMGGMDMAEVRCFSQASSRLSFNVISQSSYATVVSL